METPNHLIVSDRAHKKPLPHEEARAFIEKESGKRLDPRVVKAFLAREAEFVAVFRALSEGPGIPAGQTPRLLPVSGCIGAVVRLII